MPSILAAIQRASGQTHISSSPKAASVLADAGPESSILPRPASPRPLLKQRLEDSILQRVWGTRRHGSSDDDLRRLTTRTMTALKSGQALVSGTHPRPLQAIAAAGDGYRIQLDTGAVVTRTAEETALHVMIQSHLRLVDPQLKNTGDSLESAALADPSEMRLGQEPVTIKAKLGAVSSESTSSISRRRGRSREEKLARFMAQYNAIPTEREEPDNPLVDNSEESLELAVRLQYGASEPKDATPRSVRQIDWNAFFKLQNNHGHGDCLFHALTARPDKSNLSAQEVIHVRKQTAQVRREISHETNKVKNGNGYEVQNALRSTSVDAGKLRPVGNALLADLQEIPGIYSGTTEISQWLNIPGNPVKSVVLLDMQPGDEHLRPITKDRIHGRIDLASRDLTRETIEQRIRDSLKPALKASEESPDAPEHIALYRTTSHFQRIVHPR